MKNSTKDTTKGEYHQVTGKAKVITGKVIKSPDLEDDGHDEIVSGKIQKKVGMARKLIEK